MDLSDEREKFIISLEIKLFNLQSYIGRLESILLYGFEFTRCSTCGELFHCDDGDTDPERIFICEACSSNGFPTPKEGSD